MNQVRKSFIDPTPTVQIRETKILSNGENGGVNHRKPKYLKFKFREEKINEGNNKEGTNLMGSESMPSYLDFQKQQHDSSEPFTKTILITKLEKYIDHRVTATLLAQKCIPNDRSIPMCRSYENPIRQSPEGLLNVRMEKERSNNFDIKPTIIKQ